MFKEIDPKDRERISLSNCFNFSAAAGLVLGGVTGVVTGLALNGVAGAGAALGYGALVGGVLGTTITAVSLLLTSALRYSAAPMSQGYFQDEMFKLSAWRNIRFNKSASQWGAGTGLAVMLMALGASFVDVKPQERTTLPTINQMVNPTVN